jgi:hypothetical protein
VIDTSLLASWAEDPRRWAESSFAREHNAEAAAAWQAFLAGQPTRPPVHLGTNTRYWILNEDLNPGGAVSFEAYTTSAQTMLDFQLRAAVWRALRVAPYCDDAVGLPDHFSVQVDLQNFDEAAYFGAPVVFLDHQVPNVRPILEGERKHALFDAGLPDPLTGGWYRTAHRVHAEMCEAVGRQPEFLGRPIEIAPFGLYTSGPLTIAHQLRGNELLTDLYDDPEYVHQLLDLIVDGTIARIHAHRRCFGFPVLSSDLFYAEDDIQLISPRTLQRFVLPAHRKLIAGLTTAERVKLHACGDAVRHFRALRDELGVFEFDTGFPIDWPALRQELGSEVTIWGGPSIMVLKNGTPAEVRAETSRILNSGICEGGRFVLREGNNLAPGTPLASLAAMYETARAWVH